MGTSVSRDPAPPALRAPMVVPYPAAGPRQKLLDRVRHAIRTRHYSRRTQQAYVHWIRRYLAHLLLCIREDQSRQELRQIGPHRERGRVGRSLDVRPSDGCGVTTTRRHTLNDLEPGGPSRRISATATRRRWPPHWTKSAGCSTATCVRFWLLAPDF